MLTIFGARFELEFDTSLNKEHDGLINLLPKSMAVYLQVMKREMHRVMRRIYMLFKPSRTKHDISGSRIQCDLLPQL